MNTRTRIGWLRSQDAGRYTQYSSQEDTHPILVFMHILGRVPSRGVTGCSDQAEYSPRVLRLTEKIGGGRWLLVFGGEGGASVPVGDHH